MQNKPNLMEPTQPIETLRPIHIGEKIKCQMLLKHCSATWLASKLYCDRTNIYKIFARPSIDSDLLLRISVALKHNFFADYRDFYSATAE